jgi:hypothetical protein
MKTYPSINYYNKGIYGSIVHVFDKLDGSNIRCEWSKKSGWYKFGTRNCLIDEKHEQFGEGITIFLNKYADELHNIFRKEKIFRNTDKCMVFCEFLGDNSFAGWHNPNDKKDVVLFDIWQFKKGFVAPSDFVEIISSNLHTAEFLGKFEYNDELISKIQNNQFGNFPLKEGIICKGFLNKKGQDNVWMTKIKTKEWLTQVKNKLGDKALLDEVNGNSELIII